MQTQEEHSVKSNQNPDTPASKTAMIGWSGVAGGIWLVIAPFIFGYSDNSQALLSSLIVGIAGAVLCGFCALTASYKNTAILRQAAGWLTVVLGMYLLVSLFISETYATPSILWNNAISGTFWVILAAYGMITYAAVNASENRV